MGQERTERKRAEKAARRDAKTARKEANVVEEKKRKLSNGIIALMIFGVLAVMFAAAWGISYFSKEASIESYLENNGGKDAYGSMVIDENTTASISADKNHLKLWLNVKSDDPEERTEYYKSDEGKEQMKYLASYFLSMMKPEVRGFSASATCAAKVNGEKVSTVKVKYSDAKKLMENNGASTE